MAQRKHDMKTVEIVPGIHATTAAWNNPQYRGVTRALFPHIIAPINFLRSHMGVAITMPVIFKNIKGRTTGLFFSGVDKIFVDPRNGYRAMIETIAHEFTHLKQYSEGRLKNYWPDFRVWDGVTYGPATTYAEYRALPWEQDAFEAQGPLAEMALKACGQY
jgi:hypothetical protein